MKNNLKDFILIFLGIIALFLLNKISQNGRFQLVNGNTSAFDTSTGELYFLERNGNNNPQSGPIYKWVIQSEKAK